MRDKVCKYFPCYVSKINGRDCDDSDTCQTRRFYDKYGLDYQPVKLNGIEEKVSELNNEKNLNQAPVK